MIKQPYEIAKRQYGPLNLRVEVRDDKRIWIILEMLGGVGGIGAMDMTKDEAIWIADTLRAAVKVLSAQQDLNPRQP